MGKNPINCDICGLAVANTYNLKRHKQQHESEIIKLQCEICGKIVGNKSNFKIHTKRAHKDYADAVKIFSLVSVQNKEKPAIVIITEVRFLHSCG